MPRSLRPWKAWKLGTARTLTDFGAFHLVSFDGAPFVGMGSRDGFGAPAQIDYDHTKSA